MGPSVSGLQTPENTETTASESEHASNIPNETIAIDIVGPMHQSIEGNMWILTIIDQFTAWLVAFSIQDKTSETIARAILDIGYAKKASHSQSYQTEVAN